MAFRLSHLALKDLDHIADYIAEHQGAAARQRQVNALTKRFELLGDMPQAGRARDDDLGRGRRSFPVPPHIIIYRITGVDIVIERIVDGRRNYPSFVRGRP